jgi:hypothetical protein
VITGPYCTPSDIANIYSQPGVDLRQDDLGAVAFTAQTTTTGNFTQPPVGGTVVVSVGSINFATINQSVVLSPGGMYQVVGISPNTLILQNLGSTANVQPGVVINSGAMIGPSPLDYFIDMGSLEIEEHCLQFYSGAILATSDWVTKKCAIVAAYLFSCRRGNPVPQGITTLYKEAIEKLKSVATGRLNIPRLPKSKATVPVMSNMRPALRPHPHAVVERMRSTGTPANYITTNDPWDLTGINSPYIYDFSF